jgi:hypothetical protein
VTMPPGGTVIFPQRAIPTHAPERGWWVGSPGSLTDPATERRLLSPSAGIAPAHQVVLPFVRGWHEVSLPSSKRIAWSEGGGRLFPGRRPPEPFPQAS